jgi:streptomycin 6-kinase
VRAHHDVTIPAKLAATCQQGQWARWLATLPETIRLVSSRWSITVAEPFQPGGTTAWVAPAARGETDLVLKVQRRHAEAEHEADGLRAWNGNGAVRLHEVCHVDSNTTALLIERCRPGTPLQLRPEPEQDAVIAGILRRLWIAPPAEHGFRPLQEMCDQWAGEYEQEVTASANTLVDRELAREAMTLFRELPRSADRQALLSTDLHAGNVLAAEREPWLAIDAKPYVGDPTYDAVQHMLNCARLLDDPHHLTRRIAHLLDLNVKRLQLWLFARCVHASQDWPALADVARRVAPH